MEAKAAVVGDTDFVRPFSALGVDVFDVTESDTGAADQARRILEGNYALVVVSEDTGAEVEQVFAEVEEKAVPCVVEIPFTGGARGRAVQKLNSVLRMATGVSLTEES